MRFIVALVVGLACHLSLVAAECPNACSAHGKCGAYDMCLCYRNWMSNDCSERICQFGLAHVDTPKGDLDASSGELTGPDDTVIPNDAVYPFGTTEQYPATKDLDGNLITNSAHEYRECSNKGICDRQTGSCACFEGYDGSACQRASCPSNADGVCSGHGTCESVKEIAARDFNNVYSLWDEDATMGCVCDGGYAGADCSERVCKFGADPLYYDDAQNVRFSNFTYQFYTLDDGITLEGNYSLVFYDAHGEDWQTAALNWNATCETVTAALEELPNNAVPAGTVRCFKSDVTTDGTSPGQDATVEPIYDSVMYVHSKYTLAFPGNPGKLKQIAINKYLDGTRPTLYTDSATYEVYWHIYANGFTGENVDMVPDRCEDVTVTLGVSATAGYHKLDGLTVAEAKLLKKCLGDADGDTTNNVAEVYDWDYGDATNPHLIKLIDATQDTSIVTTDQNGDSDADYALSRYPISRLCAVSDAGDKTTAGYPVDGFGIYICANRNPPGFYAVIFWDNTLKEFKVFNRAAKDYSTTTQFYVYTTKGRLQLVNPESAAYTTKDGEAADVRIKGYYSNTVYLQAGSSAQPGYMGNLDCETTIVGQSGALDCLNKGDHVMILSTQSDAHNAADLAANPVYPNLYQVKKIYRAPKDASDDEVDRNRIVLDYSINSKFEFEVGYSDADDTSASVYKFYPPPLANQYAYAGECSHRGICNKKTGLCQCFPGYSSDNCGDVNALSN